MATVFDIFFKLVDQTIGRNQYKCCSLFITIIIDPYVSVWG